MGNPKHFQGIQVFISVSKLLQVLSHLGCIHKIKLCGNEKQKRATLKNVHSTGLMLLSFSQRIVQC